METARDLSQVAVEVIFHHANIILRALQRLSAATYNAKTTLCLGFRYELQRCPASS